MQAGEKKNMLKASKSHKEPSTIPLNCWEQTDKLRNISCTFLPQKAKLGMKKKKVHWSLDTQGERKDVHLVFVDEVEVDA